MRLVAYQTLEDRENPGEIEEFGPFPCRRADAWLGYGYYLWDTHMELGHWWGQNSYAKYIICQCRCVLDESCWDLVGNGQHRLDLQEICKEMLKRQITTKERMLLAHVIEYLKKHGIFEFDAIRALGVNTRSMPFNDPKVVTRLKFVTGNHAYLDVYPPVQICLLQKTALSLRNYRVVYPDEYIESYA